MHFPRVVVIGGLCALVVFASVGHPSARSTSQIHRELRRMVGYTIVDATSLQEIRDGRNGRRYAVLANGTVFQLESVTLALPLSDVVVFAKRVPPGLAARYPNLPDSACRHDTSCSWTTRLSMRCPPCGEPDCPPLRAAADRPPHPVIRRAIRAGVPGPGCGPRPTHMPAAWSKRLYRRDSAIEPRARRTPPCAASLPIESYR